MVAMTNKNKNKYQFIVLYEGMGAQVDKPDIGLSQIDKKILKILLSPNGQIKSTKSISRKLGIPVTTVRV
jgi:hypothetical protein